MPNGPRYVKIAKASPLIVAIVAPLITLLDIPALSQRWFLSSGGVAQPDPRASLAMSAVSLLFCAIANALMVLRFSVNTKRMEAWVVHTPLIAFWIKTSVELVNLAVYGRLADRPVGDTYGEGFYCALFSCAMSGFCGGLLLFHLGVQRGVVWKDSLKIRIDGRHFVLSVLTFVLVIAVMALVFSKIEGWLYFDGVYFSIVSTLVIGFGDLVPTHTSTKILLFPFALLSISLLANQISMIVGFFAHQSEIRKTKWRAQRAVLAREGREKSLEGSDQWGLEEEMRYLQRLQNKEHRISQTYNLVFSLVSFLVFWIVGALVFWAADDLPFGDSLYFCYVFFLTIGYGDISPTAPLARVFFVFYSLIAVPIIASFAVQTVSTIIETVSEHRLELNRAAREARAAANAKKSADDSSESKKRHHHRPAHDSERDPDHPGEGEGDGEFEAHARFVLKHWKTLDRELEASANRKKKEPSSRDREAGNDLAEEARDEAEDETREAGQEGGERLSEAASSLNSIRGHLSQEKLAEESLELAVQLESQARALLIATLPRGSKGQTLLRADRNVQRRDVKSLGVTVEELSSLWDWEEQDIRPGASEEEMLRSINRYRETFSRLLVVGSRLRRLEGTHRQIFLRTAAPDADLGSSEPGKESTGKKEMEEMNETDGAVEVEMEDGEAGVEMKQDGKGGEKTEIKKDGVLRAREERVRKVNGDREL